MPADTHGPFPSEAIRDLLGLARVLYRAETAGPAPDASRLKRLEGIGKRLRQALDLAKCGDGTMGRRAAWMHAEDGARALGEFVADSMQLAPAVRATAAALERA